MTAIEDYFRSKILDSVAVLKKSLNGEQPPYIDRLIATVTEPSLRGHISVHTNPVLQLEKLERIRWLAETGHLVEADKSLDRFEQNRRLIQGLLFKFQLVRYARKKGRRPNTRTVSTDDVLAEIEAEVAAGVKKTTAARNAIRLAALQETRPPRMPRTRS